MGVQRHPGGKIVQPKRQPDEPIQSRSPWEAERDKRIEPLIEGPDWEMWCTEDHQAKVADRGWHWKPGTPVEEMRRLSLTADEGTTAKQLVVLYAAGQGVSLKGSEPFSEASCNAVDAFWKRHPDLHKRQRELMSAIEEGVANGAIPKALYLADTMEAAATLIKNQDAENLAMWQEH